MRYRFIVIFIFLHLSIFCFSQYTAMGTWRIHTSYAAVNDIASAKNVVYGVSTGNLFSVDKV